MILPLVYLHICDISVGVVCIDTGIPFGGNIIHATHPEQLRPRLDVRGWIHRPQCWVSNQPRHVLECVQSICRASREYDAVHPTHEVKKKVEKNPMLSID